MNDADRSDPAVPGASTLRALVLRARLPLAVAIIAATTLVIAFGAGRAVRDIPPDDVRSIASAAVGARAGEYPAELSRAADALAATSGYRFEVIQETWRERRSDSPTFDPPLPVESGQPAATLMPGENDLRRFQNFLVGRGFVRSDGFFQEIRSGYTPGEVTVEGGQILIVTMVRDGRGWQNKGDGWQASQELPGSGMDPTSARLFPDLLRNIIGPTRTETGGVLRFSGAIDPIDYPGVLSSDGLSFTASPVPVEVTLDDQGRVSQLKARAINVNVTEFDLTSVVSLTFSYEAPGELPVPSPIITPDDEP